MDQLTVFACESQPVVVEGLAGVLAGYEDFDFIGSTSNLREALEGIAQRTPRIVLIDESEGLKLALQFIAQVKNTSPNSQPVLWVNALTKNDCFRALQTGARGVLRKTLPVESLVDCLRSVGRGNLWFGDGLQDHELGSLDQPVSRLSAREKEIVHHVCAGLKNKEIAKEMTISPGTVKVHMMHVFEKTRVKDRFELAAKGQRILGIDTTMESARAV